MAHSLQARKRIRQSEKREAQNRAGRSRVRTFVRAFEEAMTSGDKTAIATTFKTAMSELAIAARKGLMKKETASRKTSRLAARVKKAQAS